MKAIIPVAGVGTRLRPHTYSQPKPLIPVAGKPILGFIIDRLVKAGCTEFVFVIGYLGEKIEAFVRETYPDLTTRFVIQNKREGLGHAIYLTKDYVTKGEDIFIVLGDTIFEGDIESVIQSTDSALGLKRVDDPRDFGVAEVDEAFNIIRVIEKPTIPKSNLALVGLYKIKESEQLFAALEQIIKHEFKTQGEYHLTDAIMLMIQRGISFRGFKIQNWYDCGKYDLLLVSNAILLKKLNTNTSRYSGFQNSIIVEPVSIAANCEIKNSIIGPNVTLGENTTVNYAIVRNSIIGNDATIDDVVLHDSVIGSDTFIKGLSQSLNIGDNTEIDLSQSFD